MTGTITSRTIISTNPAKPEEVLGEVAVSTKADIEAALVTARKAQPEWRAKGVAGRVKELRKLYDYILAHRQVFEELETREMGRPISGSRGSTDWSLNQFLWNLENAERTLAAQTSYEDADALHQITYEPYGVFGVIAPWNFPLSNWVMGALQPLLAGNTVVYKASEEVPLCAQNIAGAWNKAGLPTGVFNVIQGGPEVGEILAASQIDFLDFTGSTKTGKHLYKIAAAHFIPVRLELGGSDAGIIFDDVDIEKILEPVFWAKFVNAGQICCGLKRLFVQNTIFGVFLAKFTAFVRTQKIGDPQDTQTAIGPLAAPRQQKLLAAQIDDAKAKGAQILLESSALDHAGAYSNATLLTGVTPEMRAYHEELFGPALPIWPFKSEEEAVRLANGSDYGLSAYIFTNDQERFSRVAAQLEAGSISHNGIDYSHPANPFGGYKNSGMGRVCGTIGLQHCCQVKTISHKKLPL